MLFLPPHPLTITKDERRIGIFLSFASQSIKKLFTSFYFLVEEVSHLWSPAYFKM